MRFTWMLLVPLMIGVAAPADAQHKDPPVPMATARKAAMERVPNSTVLKGELEYENGKPMYEFDLKVPGKSGYEEVKVDGTTGRVTSVKHESGHEMKGEAPRIGMDAARRTAMQRVPNSRVIKEELDHENGTPVYEFDLQVTGKSGYEEVKVDGMTGNVISVKHETSHHEK